MKNLKPVYPAVFVVAHWLLALLLVIAAGIGWYMVDIPQRTPERAYFFNLHKSFGLVTLVLIVFFTLQRARFVPPALPETLPAWQRSAAGWAHLATYALLLVCATSGYVGTNFSRWGIDFFGLIDLPSWGAERAEVYQALQVIHVWSANLLAALVAVHVAAVAKHVWSGEGVLRRMTIMSHLKGSSRSGRGSPTP